MAWRKVSSTLEHVTYEDFRQHLAQTTGKNYTTMTLAVAGLGLSVLSQRYLGFLGPRIANGLTDLGVGVAFAAALDTFLKSPNQKALENAINDADLNKKKNMRISSEFWIYEGHSGNAFTQETRNTYTAY